MSSADTSIKASAPALLAVLALLGIAVTASVGLFGAWLTLVLGVAAAILACWAILRKDTPQREAVRSKQRLQSFFDHAPIALSLSDMDGTTRMANRAMADYFGAEPSEMVGRTYSEMMAHWPGSSVSADGLIERLSAGRTLHFTAKFDAPHGGSRREMDMTFFPICDAAGEVIEIGTFAIDVTEQQQAQAALAEQQANLMAFFDYAPLQVYVTDLDHKIVMVNDWVYRETGAEVFRPENVIGLSADQMVPSSWAKMSHDNDATVVDKRGVTQVEVRGQFGGKERDIISIRFPIKDAVGKVIRIGGFVVDVTAQMDARREADDARAMLEAFFDNLPGLAFLASLNGTIIAANSYMTEHFGIPNMRSQNLVGKKGRDLLPRGWSANVYDAIKANETDGKAFAFDQKIKLPDGERNVSSVRFPIRNKDGETTHIGGLVFDRTAEKKAADAVNAAREGLHQSEKLAALGQLLAGVAHELNNPLAIVMGRAAMLKEKLAGTPHEDSIARLRDAADRCARIVKTFITMARQTGPQRTMVQIPDLIEAALDMTGHGLRAAGITLEQQIATDLPDLTADGDQLIQVLINLIINAQHAMEGQQAEPRLLISARLEMGSGRVLIEVSDNGSGIPDDVAQRIFDPFFTTKDVGVGTGLGLSVCQSMIEAHGGTLELGKPVIGGATFRISLPLGEAEAAGPEEISAREKAYRGAALIVDDEEEVAGILAEMLDGMGLTCTVVTCGQAALDAMARQPFDVIFSDIRMPRMGGSELLTAIQRDHPAMVPSIIFATGDVLHPQVDQLRATGRPIVEKPYDPEQLSAALNMLLESGEAQ